MTQREAKIRMQYIGVMTLLGRLSVLKALGADDRYCVDRAFEDANVALDDSSIQFVRGAAGGYAPVERK